MAIRVAAVLLALGLTLSVHAQDAARNTLTILADQRIDPKPFKEPMPLAKFLDAVEKQLPKDKRITLRIDGAAFGDKAKEVAATPIALPAWPARAQAALNLALATTTPESALHIDATQVIITPSHRAFFTIDHDLRGLATQPGSTDHGDDEPRSTDQAGEAAFLIRRLAAVTDLSAARKGETITVLNGTRLSIRTVGSRHAEILQALKIFARIGDLKVTTQCKLYEVDDVFYA